MNKKEKKAWSKYRYHNKAFYTVRSLLGNTWCNWFVMIGARQRGKTFSIQDYVLSQFFDPESPLYHEMFYWMRLNDVALKNMTMNNCAKMWEPILVRKYHLEKVKMKGDTLFWGKLPMVQVRGLSTAYNDKGSAMFDAQKFKGVNIIVDEMAFEKNQKRTFDPGYNLKMQIENICRNERKNVKIFLLLNNTEECPDVLALFGFIPIKHGIYKLKRKHCVIDYIPNTEGYEVMRKNALANEIDEGTGNFTNTVERDVKLIYKGRLHHPAYIVKFSKEKTDWYTVWDGDVICRYNGEKTKDPISMVRYIDEVFLEERRDMVIQMADVRAFRFRDLKTQVKFYKDLSLVKEA